MRLDPKNMLQGWYNAGLAKLGKLPKETSDLAKKKLFFCYNCKMQSRGVCRTGNFARVAVPSSVRKKYSVVYGCGCPVYQKSLSSSQCPRGYFSEGIDFPHELDEDGNIIISEEDMNFLKNG